MINKNKEGKKKEVSFSGWKIGNLGNLNVCLFKKLYWLTRVYNIVPFLHFCKQKELTVLGSVGQG